MWRKRNIKKYCLRDEKVTMANPGKFRLPDIYINDYYMYLVKIYTTVGLFIIKTIFSLDFVLGTKFVPKEVLILILY